MTLSTPVAFILCVAAIATLVFPPWNLPRWVGPLVAAVAALVLGIVTPAAAGRAVAPLLPPVGFIMAAVPLTVLLDQTGFFPWLARRLTGGRSALGPFYVLTALVTTTLNLDVAVVLLTPLAVAVAKERRQDPLALAIQPVMLALLASSALPISNLTNLIAAARFGLSTWQVFSHLAPPSLVAVLAGWVLYQRRYPATDLAVTGSPKEAQAATGGKAIALGGTVSLLSALGFVFGSSIGIAPWMVACGADIVLAVALRNFPLSAIPFEIACIVGGLRILTSAATSHVPWATVALPHHPSPLTLGAIVIGAALLANVVNNLPALLLLLPHTAAQSWSLWGILYGLNAGPFLMTTGALSTILWLSTVRRLGIQFREREFFNLGIFVGIPAFICGGVALLLLSIAIPG